MGGGCDSSDRGSLVAPELIGGLRSGGLESNARGTFEGSGGAGGGRHRGAAAMGPSERAHLTNVLAWMFNTVGGAALDGAPNRQRVATNPPIGISFAASEALAKEARRNEAAARRLAEAEVSRFGEL